MAVLYLVGSIVVLGMNYTRILPALGSIFTCAFHPASAFGGVGGCLMKSVKYSVCGLFSMVNMGSPHLTPWPRFPARKARHVMSASFSIPSWC
ncbi:MAG: alanine:cation symporter family protein [[Clostridium] leptum]